MSNTAFIELHTSHCRPFVIRHDLIESVVPYGDRFHPCARVRLADGTVLDCREYYTTVRNQLIPNG